MTPTIELIVSPSGETKLETRGFQGETCREASRFLETALGQAASEQLTAEFHAPSHSTALRQSAAP